MSADYTELAKYLRQSATYHSISIHIDRFNRWADLVDSSASLSSQVEGLTAERDHYKNAAIATTSEVSATLGGHIFGYSDGLPLWGDHVPESLAEVAVRQLIGLEAALRSAHRLVWIGSTVRFCCSCGEQYDSLIPDRANRVHSAHVDAVVAAAKGAHNHVTGADCYSDCPAHHRNKIR